MPNPQTVIISRTDALGDVVLTLPVATLIKNFLGDATRVLFLGKTYTEPLIRCCTSIDGFINYDSFRVLDRKKRADFLHEQKADSIIHVFPKSDIAYAAKSAGIRNRVGTTNRIFHWMSCNKLVRLGRKNSPLHEAQLNAKLLAPLGHSGNVTLTDIPALYNMQNRYSLPEDVSGRLSPEKFRLILHPHSNASAREWKTDHYSELISLLPENKFQIIVTGGEKEEAFVNDWVRVLPSPVINLAGKLSLEELIALLDACNGIVAASTGPLHIASALGKHALGIFPPIRPMHPGRWAPVGRLAEFMVVDKNCSDCRSAPGICHCINEITPSSVAGKINQWT